MAEEDCCIDTPFEPQIIRPKASLISMEDISPSRRRFSTNSFKNLSIKKVLNKGKFPVFLAECRESNQNYALKLFPSQIPNSKICFQNEIRFSSLNHPNIVKTVHSDENKQFKHKDSTTMASFVLTEYAPFGDFLDFVMDCHQGFTEELVRTYFRHLIEGLEYLHSRNIAHLDLKLENLLMGQNYILKIADFDLSCYLEDKNILTKGTEFYRAPELIEGSCKDGRMADIYSAGVILFVLKSGGIVPHTENTPFQGINFFELQNNNNPEFWKKHCQLQKRPPSDFSPEFRELVDGMMKENVQERWNLQDIKKSNWYNGPVYSKERLSEMIRKFM